MARATATFCCLSGDAKANGAISSRRNDTFTLGTCRIPAPKPSTLKLNKTRAKHKLRLSRATELDDGAPKAVDEQAATPSISYEEDPISPITSWLYQSSDDKDKTTEDENGQAGASSSSDSTSSVSSWLYPSKDELPDDREMTIFEHLEELRERLLVSVGAVGVAILACFAVSKDLIMYLESPAHAQGVRFLQLSPGEYFFTTLKVSGYCGLLVGSPIILYEIIAFVVPGLTVSERKFLGPIVFGSSILFYTGLAFSYAVLTPAALNFFVSYAEGVVESIWSIDQYFEFILVLMFSTGLAFQVPVIQLLLGQTRLVTGDQMLSVWRYVVVGAVVAAAVLTPSTDPLTQILLAGPLIGLYIGGALLVKVLISEQGGPGDSEVETEAGN